MIRKQKRMEKKPLNRVYATVEEEMVPTPVFLPEESHGQRSPPGNSAWGRRVRQDWVTEHAWTLTNFWTHWGHSSHWGIFCTWTLDRINVLVTRISWTYEKLLPALFSKERGRVHTKIKLIPFIDESLAFITQPGFGILHKQFNYHINRK